MTPERMPSRHGTRAIPDMPGPRVLERTRRTRCCSAFVGSGRPAIGASSRWPMLFSTPVLGPLPSVTASRSEGESFGPPNGSRVLPRQRVALPRERGQDGARSCPLGSSSLCAAGGRASRVLPCWVRPTASRLARPPRCRRRRRRPGATDRRRRWRSRGMRWPRRVRSSCAEEHTARRLRGHGRLGEARRQLDTAPMSSARKKVR